ncbi:hypothetical protein M427DRAFT_177584 [Gonapodya prolifera JEL478]|uniref:Uncharacterized protein n=1 Tax=Gonapodya prolifera (strain JEL478) TaxID=1344416 RepID=A0A139AQ29_GONPJ|nr:hypothetical protein M427DRAFT_177584 [Gonapodya prolifera JEL478]|eukprot:KXS18850.1 hypothetical protein M427DRAFT_177584 [Gonapodya prolifera JEL478]
MWRYVPLGVDGVESRSPRTSGKLEEVPSAEDGRRKNAWRQETLRMVKENLTLPKGFTGPRHDPTSSTRLLVLREFPTDIADGFAVLSIQYTLKTDNILFEVNIYYADVRDETTRTSWLKSEPLFEIEVPVDSEPFLSEQDPDSYYFLKKPVIATSRGMKSVSFLFHNHIVSIDFRPPPPPEFQPLTPVRKQNVREDGDSSTEPPSSPLPDNTESDDLNFHAQPTGGTAPSENILGGPVPKSPEDSEAEYKLTLTELSRVEGVSLKVEAAALDDAGDRLCIVTESNDVLVYSRRNAVRYSMTHAAVMSALRHSAADANQGEIASMLNGILAQSRDRWWDWRLEYVWRSIGIWGVDGKNLVALLIVNGTGVADHFKSTNAERYRGRSVAVFLFEQGLLMTMSLDEAGRGSFFWQFLASKWDMLLAAR